MIKKSSPALLQFYRDWLAWAEGGAEEWGPHDFSRRYGLCLCQFFGKYDMEEEMKDQFVAAGLSRTYPFGYSEFHRGRASKSLHKDEARLAWVRARIAEASE